MSSQGTGPPSQHHGLKNTSDPRSKDPITESAGQVASDSLAAESYNAGGEFSENRNAAPSGQSGSGSTLNTTDTSAARKLDAAEDSSERYDEIDRGERGPAGVKYAEGLGGQPKFDGATNASGYTGGPSGGAYSDSTESGYSGPRGDTSGYSGSGKTGSDDYSSGGRGSDSSSNVDRAPNYIADVYLGDTSKPKGKNLTEDENLEGKRNTDFEIGGKNDPARANVQNFANASATGQRDIQRDIDGENTYSRLGDDDA